VRRFFLGLALTAASVALLARLIDWHRTWGALQAANPLLIALAVTSLVLSLAAKTLRWRLLLPPEAGVTTPRLYRILHISFLLNNVLPARLGDVARVAMTSRQPGLRFGHVISSLLTERVTDTITLLTFFVAISPFLPIPNHYRTWLHVAWFLLAGVFVATAGGVILRGKIAGLSGRLARRHRWPMARVVREEAGSFGEGWRQLFSRAHVVRIWGWSGAAWVGAFAINYFLMQALDIHTPFAVAVLLTCTTNLAMLLPSSPGYIGVFHLAATLSLAPFDVDTSKAFSFAILAWLVNVLPVSILGAAFLLAGRESISLSLGRGRALPEIAGPSPGDR
jgi:uncharacterized protein (TIRG00374 family)